MADSPQVLDDAAAIAAADPSGMLASALELPAHCRDGHAAGLATAGLPSGDDLRSVALVGMGGSGVSGDLIRALYRERLTIPVDVVRGPVLPEHCGKDTLVVCCSYSGGTAETVEAFEEAARRGCRLLVVTSGGALGARAEELEAAVVGVPAAFPKPRAAMGFLTMGTLGALEAMGVVPPLDEELDEATEVLSRLADELDPARPRERNQAKQLAAFLEGRLPVVWGAEGIGHAAATRWKTELNENAKVPAWSSSMPELDHNEVVGWSPGMGDAYAVVALRHEDEHPEIAGRFPVSMDVARESGAVTEEVWASGDGVLPRLLSLCMKGGVTSVYLGVLRGVDPGPIVAIDRIKAALAPAGTGRQERKGSMTVEDR